MLIKKLEMEIRKNGHVYKLITRSKNRAIYSQSDSNRLIAYEVFKIFIRGERYSEILKRVIPPTERFPSNESFGKTAWTFSNLKPAMEKYNELKP